MYGRDGGRNRVGGHASTTLQIPTNAKIQKVEVIQRGWGCGIEEGVRVYPSTGQAAGEFGALDRYVYDAEEDDDDNDSDD